jgi:hypothetical protein
MSHNTNQFAVVKLAKAPTAHVMNPKRGSCRLRDSKLRAAGGVDQSTVVLTLLAQHARTPKLTHSDREC